MSARIFDVSERLHPAGWYAIRYREQRSRSTAPIPGSAIRPWRDAERLPRYFRHPAADRATERFEAAPRQCARPGIRKSICQIARDERPGDYHLNLGALRHARRYTEKRNEMVRNG
jgi:hypothetical protein